MNFILSGASRKKKFENDDNNEIIHDDKVWMARFVDWPGAERLN